MRGGVFGDGPSDSLPIVLFIFLSFHLMNTDYTKQGKDFCAKTGTTIEARFTGYKKHFPSDDEARPTWEIRMVRGSRSYTFPFGSSINDWNKWQKELWDKHPMRITSWDHCSEALDNLMQGKRDPSSMISNKGLDHSTFAPAGEGYRPTEYDILACLEKYEPADDVDSFAEEFGIEKPSEAIRVYEAVKKEYAMLQALYNDEEMEELQEIA